VRTREKLALLTSLYLSQGLPFGFFSQAVPILMRQEGRSLPDIRDRKSTRLNSSHRNLPKISRMPSSA
jgi:hypothetical protein